MKEFVSLKLSEFTGTKRREANKQNSKTTKHPTS